MKKLITVLLIRLTAIMTNMPIKKAFIANFALSNYTFLHYIYC